MKLARKVISSPKSEIQRLQKIKKSEESAEEKLDRIEAKIDLLLNRL